LEKYGIIIVDVKYITPYIKATIHYNLGRLPREVGKMNKLAELIANGEIMVEELAGAPELIERAKLVKEGLEACKKNIKFPLGTSSVSCYRYMDRHGEYEAWGECTIAGTFTCSTNWGGNHVVGSCNITNYKETFLAFDKKEFAQNLERFLRQQIEQANPEKADGADGAR
jgi:hypothetical protein